MWFIDCSCYRVYAQATEPAQWLDLKLSLSSRRISWYIRVASYPGSSPAKMRERAWKLWSHALWHAMYGFDNQIIIHTVYTQCYKHWHSTVVVLDVTESTDWQWKAVSLLTRWWVYSSCNFAACYQLPQSVLKIGFVLTKRWDTWRWAGFSMGCCAHGSCLGWL